MENINLFKEILKEIGLNLKHESSRTNSYDNGEFQQNEIVSKLSKNKTFADHFNIFSIEQYLCMNNKVWEPYLDSIYGDLVITNKECAPLFYIDLKVSMSPKYYGSVTILSLFNFGDVNNDGNNASNHYYLTLTNKGDARLVNRNEMFNAFKNELLEAKKSGNIITELINASLDRKNIFRNICAKDINVKIKFDKIGYLYEKDYIVDAFFDRHPELNILNN